jgi:hypothetical protein
MAKWKMVLVFLGGTLLLAYLGLMIPAAEPPEPQIADASPFAWDRDGYWAELQNRFEEARGKDCRNLAPSIEDRLLRTDQLLQQVEETRLPPNAQLIVSLAVEFFELAPLVAACPAKIDRFVRIQTGIRTALKRRSQEWDMNLRTSRETLYRVLYGTRAAVEEVLLQASSNHLESLQQATQEPSATPSAKVLGMTVHSGDIMLSRGTAATSALIARGADFPGNFSHAALVHVDPETSIASIVEAHIESGVVVSSLRSYLEDRKVRVMLLRPRADLPAIREDVQIPHQAASYAVERAVSAHIPYDFTMDHSDPEKLYCSEVAYDAYMQFGIELWSAQSTISSPGLARWLSGFGVTHMTTLGPSDLEYDPQLSVVAEWRDLDALWRDHLDNAVVDALLESAEAGLRLDYSLPRLPFARMAKGMSLILNRMGRVGPVPEGMSATAALRNQWFSSLQNDLVGRVEAQATAFQTAEQYRAPYWRLVSFAREALKE